jgi:hypothetical protein
VAEAAAASAEAAAAPAEVAPAHVRRPAGAGAAACVRGSASSGG